MPLIRSPVAAAVLAAVAAVLLAASPLNAQQASTAVSGAVGPRSEAAHLPAADGKLPHRGFLQAAVPC